MEIVGQIVSGEYAEIAVRQKSGETLEIGELLVSEEGQRKRLLQVFDLCYGSALREDSLQLMSGLRLEGKGERTSFFEEELRNYVVAKIKPVLDVEGKNARAPKSLPQFFSQLRRITADDLKFLEKPERSLYLGKVRSGSKTIPFDVFVNGEDVLSHHVLVAASTGRGKSNLVKVMLWELLDKDYCGALVIDPHGEYHRALSQHPARSRLKCYSTKPEHGEISLRINHADVKPWHFRGVMPFSDAQEEAMYVAWKEKKEEWISHCLSEGASLPHVGEGTLSVLQRRLSLVLDERAFSADGGKTIVKDVVDAVLSGDTVVIDTSGLSNESELLAASVFTNAIFEKCKNIPPASHPVVSVVLEEAPRVLAESAGANVFSSIAREGRKFGVGLVAITQLASVIPRDVLANLSTKIILGNEMAQERDALIGSAAQDLSSDFRAIAALEKGEAIVTSVFTKFAIPVRVPKFEEFAKQSPSSPTRKAFTG